MAHVIQNPGKRNICLNDVHLPHENPLDEVFGFIHDRGCDVLILNGDILDCAWASHWNEEVFRLVGMWKHQENFQKDMDAGRRFLASVRKAAGNKCQIIWVPGNHEAWLWEAAHYHHVVALPPPPKKLMYSDDLANYKNDGIGHLLQREMGDAGLGVTFLPYNMPLKVGKVVYLHGHQLPNPSTSMAGTAKRWPGTNLAFGHWHTETRLTLPNAGNPRNLWQHISVPALTRLDHGYLKSKSTTWLNGFLAVDYDDRGFFDARVIRTFNGKLVR